MSKLLRGQPALEEMIDVARHNAVPLRNLRVTLARFLCGEFATTDAEMAAAISAQFKLIALRRAGVRVEETIWKPGDEGLAERYVAANSENLYVFQRPIPHTFAYVMSVVAARRIDEFPSLFGPVPSAAEACYRIVRLAVPSGSSVAITGAKGYIGSAVKALCRDRYSIIEIEDGDDISACRMAECVVSAVGWPGLVTQNDVMPGSVAIDAGFSVSIAKPWESRGDFADGVGDVASWLTPVPGGIGPFQISIIIEGLLARVGVRSRAQLSLAK